MPTPKPTFTMQLWRQDDHSAHANLVCADNVESRRDVPAIVKRHHQAGEGTSWWVTLTPNLTGPGDHHGPFTDEAWLSTVSDDGRMDPWCPTTPLPRRNR